MSSKWCKIIRELCHFSGIQNNSQIKGKPSHNNFLRKKNTKEVKINQKGTRKVMTEEDCYVLRMKNLTPKFYIFSTCVFRDLRGSFNNLTSHYLHFRCLRKANILYNINFISPPLPNHALFCFRDLLRGGFIKEGLGGWGGNWSESDAISLKASDCEIKLDEI